VFGVAADGNIGANRAPLPGEAPAAALVSELSEALTALGNYLASANRIFISSAMPLPQPLSEALQKSLHQHERAIEATRRLRAVNRSRKTVKADCLIGLR
jgi:hypothetical protein